MSQRNMVGTKLSLHWHSPALAELKCAEESRQAWKQYIASLKEMVGSMTGKTNDHTASKNAATIHKEDTK